MSRRSQRTRSVPRRQRRRRQFVPVGLREDEPVPLGDEAREDLLLVLIVVTLPLDRTGRQSVIAFSPSRT